MTTDAIKHLGAEFHRAADSLADTLARLDNARLDRLAFLRRCSKDSAARLVAIKEEIRTLPEQIAKWDAEAARLESQTAEDLLRQALGAVVLHPQPPGEVIEALLTQPRPEPYRAGLPPDRLRKVWAEWEMVDGVVYVFQGNKYRCTYTPPTEWLNIFAEHTSRASYRPHRKTWAEVEAMADEAEQPTTPPAPTLLDLTKLPPGTVCEALDDIPRWNGRTVAAGVPFTLRDASTAEGDEFPMVVTTNGENSYCIPYVVPARVVKEGGEQ